MVIYSLHMMLDRWTSAANICSTWNMMFLIERRNILFFGELNLAVHVE